MANPFDSVFLDMAATAEAILRQEKDHAVANIQESLSTPGSPVPFVASAPGNPSFDWYGGEMVRGITGELEVTPDRITLTVISDAVSTHPPTQGHHYSADAEFGHFWDGMAYDPADGNVKQVAPPHDVAPRPHMTPEFERSATRTEAALIGALGRVGE